MTNPRRDSHTVRRSRSSFHLPCVESLAFFAIWRQSSFTMRELPYLKATPRHLPWVLGLGVVMGVIGPFGMYEVMGLGTRILYFVLTSTLIWLQVIGCAILLASLETFDRWATTGRMALAGLLASVPGTLEIIVFHSWLVRPTPIFAAPYIFPDKKIHMQYTTTSPKLHKILGVESPVFD